MVIKYMHDSKEQRLQRSTFLRKSKIEPSDFIIWKKIKTRQPS
uniref:Uncharacterized protein n=1 Tax=Anguilla anguilla TaxID=7936 RepID=A0A0E9TD85_ANGAN